MKVVVAVDSFKGSLSSMDAGFAVRDGILRARPDAEIIVKPLADGGEGTTDALIEGMGGERISITVTGPLGKPVDAYYGYLKETDTAIIEMASAAGIVLVPNGEKNPLTATTFGVGEMIKDAAERGCRNFIIGLGGSVTNDGGIGMLQALGYTFLDKNFQETGQGAQALGKITSIKTDNVYSKLKECHFQVACDVTNPLCGKNGATYIYGPQKGVSGAMLDRLDADMSHFAAITSMVMGNDFLETEGAGAAGGLGFALLSYLNARLIPGIELILDAVRLQDALKDADIAVTGEGRLDHQTAMGKAPVGVARLAKRYNVKVLAFAGGVTKDARACNKAGIDAFFPIVRGITTLEEAMEPENARANMTDTVEQVFRII
ncbi:glycerate kinase [Muricomes intestini]|jgi:glycerate kinase|uniref:Glycerate kinase n=1 Tax=Muricomes intestini TaxID=1796634 RepID=A0A4R3JZZ1_9FIRM|nr:glycerate kinase [Muricomes intestini]TCS74866.1 glycerate kinase [Muricomes intestini]HAX52210.1 glycerate kinase [Lachnospiraceae bacterium]HCR84659.1 glycerate kinase [Lachnospiraceae bacterium]